MTMYCRLYAPPKTSMDVQPIICGIRYALGHFSSLPPPKLLGRNAVGCGPCSSADGLEKLAPFRYGIGIYVRFQGGVHIYLERLNAFLNMSILKARQLGKFHGFLVLSSLKNMSQTGRPKRMGMNQLMVYWWLIPI